jgi:hypothetical protein
VLPASHRPEDFTHEAWQQAFAPWLAAAEAKVGVLYVLQQQYRIQLFSSTVAAQRCLPQHNYNRFATGLLGIQLGFFSSC